MILKIIILKTVKEIFRFNFRLFFSAESGFSDGRDDESDEEMEDEENVEKRVRIIGSRRRNRKVN